MPGALQVLAVAALLHGVQTIYTYDNKEPTIRGSLDLTATQVAQATLVFQQALLPHPLWFGPLPVCLAVARVVLLFHGMICIATTDPLRQGSDLRQSIPMPWTCTVQWLLVTGNSDVKSI